MVSAREWITSLQPYVPGLHYGDGYHDLASNESLESPPKSVLDAITATFEGLNRYPDSTATTLRLEIAKFHGVDPDCVIVGNGSDELIYLLGLAYLADGGSAVAAAPGYRMNEIVTQLVNGVLLRVPLMSWRHDLAAMADVQADVAFVVNPHNPTGTSVTADQLDEFISRRAAPLVVVDEAYIDFASRPDTHSAIRYTDRGDVAVLRTFSKIYGLAGLRIGYLVSSPAIVRALSTIRAPFSVGTIPQAAALAALHARDYYEARAMKISARRDSLIRELRGHGFSMTDSQANFVFAFDLDETHIVNGLGKSGIIVRPGSNLGIPGSIRMTVPPEDGAAHVVSSMKQLV
jgi:histidinol-phosphate aminotransferase